MPEHHSSESPEPKPLAPLLEGNTVLANRYRQILNEHYTPFSLEIGRLMTAENVAREAREKADIEYEKKRMVVKVLYHRKEWDEYERLLEDESLANEKWKRKVDADPSLERYDMPEAQVWFEKYQAREAAKGVVEDVEQTLREKFSKYYIDTLEKSTQEREAAEKVTAYRQNDNENSNVSSTFYEARQAAQEMYMASRGKKYEGRINAFLDTVRAYQEEKAARLQNRSALPSGKGIAQRFAEKMNGMAARARQRYITQAVWAASIAAIAFAVHTEGTTIIDTAVATTVDSMYKAAKQSPLDTATNIIFHSIAGDDTIPKEWRTYLANEDKNEFLTEHRRSEYVQGTPNKQTKPTVEQEVEYLTLREMNAEHGNPHVAYGQDRIDGDRAYYTHASNTMHLPTYTGRFILSEYLAELSHAEQWRSDPKKYDAWLKRDWNGIDSIATVKNISKHDAQLTTYDNQNTLEHEAHSVIEPKLKAEFEQKKEALRAEILEQLHKKHGH